MGQGCARCKAEDSRVLEQLGEPRPRDIGKAYEVETTFRCHECGATWTLLEESGLGGHGRFWKPAAAEP